LPFLIPLGKRNFCRSGAFCAALAALEADPDQKNPAPGGGGDGRLCGLGAASPKPCKRGVAGK